MKCIYCGNELKEGSLFCPYCGKEVQIVPDYNIYDDDYDEQLNGYYKYIQKKTDKKIHLYLYSLISGEYREIKKWGEYD